jgi:Na+/phosphate symporter
MFLLIAGLIMVITLWLSKKAKSVVKTELRLSDQDIVDERFQSSGLARSLVRSAMNVNKAVQIVVPNRVLRWIENRFDTTPFKNGVREASGASFDMMRASVNLVVASILIAFATSLKLPLSTTYVTFMVAMGSSLADGAWGRESAVYRITGVVTVIGGWFFTAFSAFTISLLVALILYWTKLYGLIGLVPLVVFIIIRTHVFHNKKAKEENEKSSQYKDRFIDGANVYETCSENVTSLLMASSKSLNKTIDSLIKEKRKKLKDDVKTIKDLNKQAKSLKKDIPKTLQRLTEESFESAHSYIEVIDYLREMMHCLSHIVNPSYDHVDNNHTPLTMYQQESLKEVSSLIQSYITDVVASISNSDFSTNEKMIEKSQNVGDMITKTRKKQLKSIKKEPGSTRTNMLFMDILSEVKNLSLHMNNVYKAFRDLAEQNYKITMKSIELTHKEQ